MKKIVKLLKALKMEDILLPEEVKYIKETDKIIIRTRCKSDKWHTDWGKILFANCRSKYVH